MLERISFPTPPRVGGRVRTLLRLVAMANALYQGTVGLIALLSPTLVSELFHIGIPEPAEAGVIRLLGALACGNAMMLVIVSKQGEGARLLARWALASGAINLLADAWIGGGGDLAWGTLMVAMVLQAALVAILIVWMRTPGAGLPAKRD